MKLLDARLLDRLSLEARRRPRLRQNHNLHSDYEDPCQRLLNAIEPGTYIRPHRHLDPPKEEAFIALRGRMALVLFDDGGEVSGAWVISPGAERVGAQVPAGTWHALVCLEPGSVFFECKPGPYRPLSDKDFAPWAPPEGSEGAKPYLEQLLRRVDDWCGGAGTVEPRG